MTRLKALLDTDEAREAIVQCNPGLCLLSREQLVEFISTLISSAKYPEDGEMIYRGLESFKCLDHLGLWMRMLVASEALQSALYQLSKLRDSLPEDQREKVNLTCSQMEKVSPGMKIHFGGVAMSSEELGKAVCESLKHDVK